MAKKKGFLEHLDNLESVAEQLRGSSRVDLDRLIPLVDSAMDSYKECSGRIAAVEALLKSRQVFKEGADPVVKSVEDPAISSKAEH